jgi:hypothetical protein
MREFNENDIIWYCQVNIDDLDRINIDILRCRVKKTYKYDLKLGGRGIGLYANEDSFLIGEKWIYESKQEAIDAMLKRLQDIKEE